MSLGFESDPVSDGISAAARVLAAAGVERSIIDEYAQSAVVRGAVANALAEPLLTEGAVAQHIERSQLAELVGLASLSRELAGEPAVSDGLVERIRRIIREIINGVGGP